MRKLHAALVMAICAMLISTTAAPAQALDSISYREASKGGQVTDYGWQVFFSGDLYGEDPAPAYPNPGYLIRERVEVFENVGGTWTHRRAADTFSGGPNDRFEGWSGTNSSELCSYAVNTYAWYQFNGYIFLGATSTSCGGTNYSSMYL